MLVFRYGVRGYLDLSYRIPFRQLRLYSSDTVPETQVLWFYATDLPVKKLKNNKIITDTKTKTESSPLAISNTYDTGPKKFMVFSQDDSKRIEEKYMRLRKDNGVVSSHQRSVESDTTQSLGLSRSEVLVREDGLFVADLDKFLLSPTYWPGPKYEIRRGIWFNDESFPCEQTIAEALEALRHKARATNSFSIKSSQGITKEIVHPNDPSVHIQLTLLPGDPDNAKMELKLSEDDPRLNFWAKVAPPKSLKRYTAIDQKKLDSMTSKAEGAVDGSDKSNTSNSGQDSGSGSIANIMSSLFNLKDKTTKMENQMEHDYPQSYHIYSSGSNNRPVDHLVLCVHGIGQKLSQRLESMSFVHDVNLLRSHLKNLYKGEDKNNGIQVLPVLWRHDVDFAMTRDQLHLDDENALPVSLKDITVSGITSVRSIIGDVVLDVLLYNAPKLKEDILSSITLQINTVLRRFMKLNNMQRPPKVSVIGHSLGSVISYDLLSSRSQKGTVLSDKIDPSRSQLEFPVENLICLGSPLGLYQLIQGKYLVNEQLQQNVKALYNIFHPSDPISYRMEPLITPEAADLPAAQVPFLKGSFLSQVQEFTELSQKFSTNASSVWSSLSKLGPWSGPKQDSILGGGQGTENASESDSEKASEKASEGEAEAASKSSKLTKDQIDKIKEKIKIINPTGRVDYEIQEGMLDITLLTAIASHMSYFDDQDLADFIQNILKPRPTQSPNQNKK